MLTQDMGRRLQARAIGDPNHPDEVFGRDRYATEPLAGVPCCDTLSPTSSITRTRRTRNGEEEAPSFGGDEGDDSAQALERIGKGRPEEDS